MSSIRSVGLLARRVGSRQTVRPIMNTRILPVRRNYATAAPPTGNSTASNPLLWIGKQSKINIHKHTNMF
jgi:hypothetical protein